MKRILQKNTSSIFLFLLISGTALAQPTFTSVPVNGATAVNQSGNIVLTFNTAIQGITAVTLDNSNIDGKITLKETNSTGADIPFDASIDAAKLVVTIDPVTDLPSGTVIYVAIGGVEAIAGGADITPNPTSFSFTVADYVPPTITFNPLNAATGVSETANITITFNEAVRKLDNSAITAGDILSLVELKLTNDAGASVPFTGSINGGNTVITIDPTSTLSSNTVYYVEMNPVEDIFNNATTASSITFTTGDSQPPVITFNPLNGATGVPVASNLTITFNEAVRNIDNSPITAGDLLTLVELKLTNNAGAPVPFSASINGANTIITIDPTSNLTGSTVYYLEINPIEDSNNNPIVATSITFTTVDNTPPVPTFNPVNGATGVVETSNIIITFDEAIRNIDNSPITAGDLLTLVELKLTNNAGASVPFSASINGANTIITIDPTAILASNTLYYVEINPVEDASNNATTAANITFTTGDTQPPLLIFNPAGGATNVSAVGNITITFSEPIRKTDDTPVTVGDLATLVELKLTNNGGAAVPFTPSINGANTIITINPNATLLHNQVYYVEMNIIEDAANNAITAQNITFTTEDRPSIINFLPGVAERCIGDNVTVNGLRFTGTGNPITGNTQPTVYVNAVAVPVGNIVSFNSTQVVFTLPSIAAGNYPITVRNNDSDLLSTGTSFDVRPAINTGLTVTPATFSPAQNTNVNIVVNSTQDANYSYSLILTAAPGGYSLTPPATVHTLTGNNGTRTLNTSEGPDPDLTSVGDYTYRIDVSRNNCVTRTLTNTPFILNVASLAVNVSATNSSVCAGNSTTLIGSASGGTGFYQFRWTSVPAGYTSSASSPTVFPPGNIRYNLEVEDNAGNIVTDFVDIVINSLPTVSIDPAPGETTVRTNYTIEDSNYPLYGSPAGGSFSGPGVTQSGSVYNFNPQNAGIGDSDITYTFTDGAGCSAQDTEVFSVSAAAVNGLDLAYCQNVTLDGGLSPVTASIPGGWQFTRLVFYSSGCTGEPAPWFSACGLPNPLAVTSTAIVTDIQTGSPVSRPTQYSLNLNTIRDYYGYSSTRTFYILVYAKTASGIEDYINIQFFRVLENGPAPQIVGINEDQNICSDGGLITLTSSVTGYTVSSYSITSPFSSALTTPGGVFNPAHADLAPPSGPDERPLSITMSYSDFNNCPSSVIKNFTWVKKPPLINVSDTSFCQFANPATFKIEATANRSADRAYWYDEDPALPAPSQVLDSINFVFKVPGIDGQNNIFEDFFVQQSYKGCKGNAREVKFFVNPAPNATITNSPICEDRVFNLSGPEQSPGIPYAKYEWFFGDGTTEILLNDSTTTYNYGPNSANTLRTITLIVTTGLGCTAKDEILNTVVSPNPKPDFTYRYICADEVTQFDGISDISTSGTKFEWDFGDATIIPSGLAGSPAPEGGTIEDPYHKLAAAGDYNVTVTTYTPTGCFASKTKTITVLDTLRGTSSNPYLMDALESGKGYWRLEDINGNSTWNFGTPTTQVMNEFSSPAWVTNPTGQYSPNEYSFLNSPCFNIQNIDRPVLSLDYILNSEAGKDGLVIEFSKDGGVTWSPLGNVNSGFNWYNTNGFVLGNIGVSSFGWSGNSWELPGNIAGDTLVQGRRALDNIPGLTNASDRAKLRLRIAFKTNGDGEFNGFAFNNMTIGSRNRILLIENFTNAADANYISNNVAYKAIPTGEVVKIQYHVGAPGQDENYTLNTADPSARAAFYGIPLNEATIPRGYIDGKSLGNFISALWVQTERDQRSLKVAPYAITVSTLEPENPTYLKVSIDITALQNIPVTWKPVLQIAIVQKTAGDNEYVLRKLIPSAVGRKLPSNMQLSDNIIIVDSVRLENKAIDFSGLAIVAFVQDEQTREVYQAALDEDPDFLPDPDLITGIEDPEYANHINLYPNPANQEVNIELPAAVNKPTPVALYDAFGRVVYQSVFKAGERTKTISTASFADGIYMMQLLAPQGSKVTRKVMVKH